MDTPNSGGLIGAVSALSNLKGQALAQAVASLSPPLELPRTVLESPERLQAHVAALVEQTPVLLEYLLDKIRAVAPDGEAAVDPEADIASLGLNSLDAAAVVISLESDLGVEAPLAEMFDGQSIAALAVRLTSAIVLAGGFSG